MQPRKAAIKVFKKKEIIEKIIEKKKSPVEEKAFNPPHLKTSDPVLCGCGKPVHGETNQCWACAHRA